VRRVLIGLALGAVLLASCGSAGDEVPPAPVVYESREVELGERFQIVLPTNAMVGYLRELIEIDDDIVQLTESEYIADPNSVRLVGNVGKTIFHFQAVGRGETTLKWVRRRPWEKDVGPMRAHIVLLTMS